MLKVPGHQGNTNQNPLISLLIEWLSSRTHITTNVGEEVRIKEPSYTVGGKL
jgi:hypothetical protein